MIVLWEAFIIVINRLHTMCMTWLTARCCYINEGPATELHQLHVGVYSEYGYGVSVPNECM